MARFTGPLTLDPASVNNSHISSAAGDIIDADKLQHVYKPGTNFATAIGGTPATREELVFVASKSGTVRGFHCLLAVDGSSTSIAFDLKKNGSSILSSAVTVTDSTGDGTVSDGTVSSPTIAADDRLSISMTVTSATGAQGAFAWIEVEESSAP